MKYLSVALVSLKFTGIVFLEPIPYVELKPTPVTQTVYLKIESSTLVDMHNQIRRDYGLGELRQVEHLNNSASLKLDDMIANKYFAHISPTGKQPWDFMDHWIRAGENLAKGYGGRQQRMDAWMLSEKHRFNILLPEFNEIGIAEKNGLTVVHFARN